MKVLITGGGTGGHIMPALAIAQKIIEKNYKNDILYVGTKNGLESELVPKEGFKFKTVKATYLERKISLKNVKTMFITIEGILQSLKIINKYKPDIVIGTGGYVCGPVVLAACLKGIPSLIHEQNVFPGITNKILSKFITKIAISFSDSEKYFKYKDKLVLTGNPVRNEIINYNRKKSREKFGIRNNEIFIYSFGGSGGQKSLNDAMIEVIKNNKNNKKIKILHVTGKRLYNEFLSDLKNSNIITLPPNIEILEYMYDAPSALAASDLVIGSSGAITIAEITAIGIPSILIPKAYTAENHQEYNARALEKKGAAKVLLEKEITGEKLEFTINSIINDNEVLKKMSINSKKLGKVNAKDKIYNTIVELSSISSRSNK